MNEWVVKISGSKLNDDNQMTVFFIASREEIMVRGIWLPINQLDLLTCARMAIKMRGYLIDSIRCEKWASGTDNRGCEM